MLLRPLCSYLFYLVKSYNICLTYIKNAIIIITNKGGLLMNKGETLFSAPINSIKLNDIEQFCSNEIKECEIIDYKADLNDGNLDKIVETVAAMANTDGGIILVGIPERKYNGGNNGIPDSVEGFKPSVKNSIQQQIANVCRAKLQPPFLPEMIDIDLNGTDKIVLLIRINRDLVPKLPIFHREKGIKVRSGEDVKFATPDQVQLLLNESNQSKFPPNSMEFPEFTANTSEDINWISIMISVPQKRFHSLEILSTSTIKTIYKTVENHTIAGRKTWLDRYYSKVLKQYKKLDQDHYRPEFTRTAYTINLLPRQNYIIRSADQSWYNLNFRSEGIFTALIGLTNHTEMPFGPESIASAFYSAIDLFSQTSIRSLYSNLLWTEKCNISFRVRIHDGSLNKNIVPFQAPYDHIKPFSTCDGNIDFKFDENPSKKAKDITAYILAQLGCWNYETGLDSLDLVNKLY